MILSYRYRPPIKYLFLGIMLLPCSILFGFMVGKEEWWVSLGVLFFAIILFASGFSFLLIYVRKFNVGGLVVSDDYIEIPERWRNRVTLKFNDIKDIGEFNTYDHIIEIESSNAVHLIERNWMNKKDFNEVRNRLQKIRPKD